MLTKIVSFFVVMLPILEPYGFFVGSTPLSKIAMLFCCLLICLWPDKKRLEFPKYYKAFLIYAFTFPIVCGIIAKYYSGTLSSFVTVGLYSICVGLYLPYLDLKKVCKYYRLLVYICCGVFIIQELIYFVAGYRMSGLLPFLPVIYDMSTEEFMAMQAASLRGSSVFLEPSHFAEYLLPYLAIVLGKCLIRRRIVSLEMLFITAVLFFLQSGTGVMIALILYFIYIIKLKMNFVAKYVFVCPILLIIGICSYAYISETEVGKELLGRSDELVIDETARVSSGTMRIYRGYYVFEEMPFFEQLFGVGAGNVGSVALNSSVVSMFVEGDGTKPMLNVVQVLLVGYGILGILMFSIHIINLLRKNTYHGSLIAVSFICLAFVEFFFCSGKMLFYISLSFAFQRFYLTGRINNNKIQYVNI